MIWPAIFALTMKEANKKKITHSLVILPSLVIFMLTFTYRIESDVDGKIKQYELGEPIGEKYPAEVISDVGLQLIDGIIFFGGFLSLILVGNLATTVFESKTSGLLLSKPIPRWRILTHRYTGVVVFIGIVLFYLHLGVWGLLAIKILIATKVIVWFQLLDTIYATLVLIAIFASIYSFTVLICIIGKIGIIGAVLSGLFYTLTLFTKSEFEKFMYDKSLLISEPAMAIHNTILFFFPNGRELGSLAQSFISDIGSNYYSWNSLFYALAFSFVNLIISIVIINRRDFPNYAVDS